MQKSSSGASPAASSSRSKQGYSPVSHKFAPQSLQLGSSSSASDNENLDPFNPTSLAPDTASRSTRSRRGGTTSPGLDSDPASTQNTHSSNNYYQLAMPRTEGYNDTNMGGEYSSGNGTPQSGQGFTYPPHMPLANSSTRSLNPSRSNTNLSGMGGDSGSSGQGRRVRMPDADPEKGSRGAGPSMPMPGHGGSGAGDRPGFKRNQSWDLLAGLNRIQHSYEEFDSRHASEAHLAFADGDIPKDRVSRFYNYLLNVSIVTRWIVFIIPVLALLWIPGILNLTSFPNAKLWGIKLIWWSIWFSVVWGGWWAALAASRILPPLIRKTIGLVAVGTRRYIDWLEALHRYVAFTAWSLAMWVTFQPLIDNRQGDTSDRSRNIVDLIAKLLFALFLDAALLLFEKFSIQWIAGKFHERSYAERIADQKFAVRALVVLYRNSTDIPGRSDTLKQTHAKTPSVNASKMLKSALKGVRKVATTTTTALGNVASEIAGSSVLQPNSPQAVVQTALESANKSRLLARRLYYSFVRPGQDYLFVEDIARFFPSMEHADKVYTLFDKDSNGDVSRDEIEMACLEFHREQLSIEHSMQDLDSAVGRLDNILMTVYVLVAMLIVAIALEAQLVTLVTGAGTAILGLSWLIGGALSDVLTSIIFLFIKHPFDVGDRVVISKVTYTVKEIRLLSSIFLDPNGALVQAPNKVLDGQFIENIRRSPQMSESFSFDVSYSTNFEDLEVLRQQMLQFLENNRRDYYPAFDVSVVDFPEQEKMTLAVDIKYKSNSQQAAIKAKRRNRWICALKAAMATSHIYGPKGDPHAAAGITKYTQVPWDVYQHDQQAAAPAPQAVNTAPRGGWELRDGNMVAGEVADDVFGEADELNLTSPRRNFSTGGDSTTRTAVNMPSAVNMPPGPTPTQVAFAAQTSASGVDPMSRSGSGSDVIEMRNRGDRI